jgi:putative ABC transport system ATP-binding protein
LDGADVRTLDPIQLRRRVGMIFQTPVLFDGGVRANLAYGLNGSADDQALASALDASGLPPSYLDRESTALSVGQAQRVCIARALVRHPEVLLMDEPTSALDRDASARIEDLIRSLAGRTLTVVLVTHDLAQAQRVADDAILLVEGKVAAAGLPDEVSAAWPEEGA